MLDWLSSVAQCLLRRYHHNNMKMKCWHWNYWVLVLKLFVPEHNRLMENATVKIPFLCYPLILVEECYSEDTVPVLKNISVIRLYIYGFKNRFLELV